jgi:hypothetical protein
VCSAPSKAEGSYTFRVGALVRYIALPEPMIGMSDMLMDLGFLEPGEWEGPH